MSYEDPSPPILLSLYKQNLIKPVTRSPVPCRIKSNGTLCLGGIISVFTESITEEHAWAVIYGSCKTLEEMLTTPLEGEKRNFYFITSPSNIQIHVDGKVHPNTYLSAYDTANQGSRRKLMTSVDEAIAKLGEVIYNTLDYGLTDDDERQLTPGLENLLELMLSSDSEDTEIEEDHRTIETDDEGIEQDHDDLSSTQQQSNHKLSHNLSFLYRVLNLCTNHLSVSKEADLHFKNVCRALVTEALELSFFIERVQNRDLNQAKEIQELALLDWACLWKETMFQLRQGVKLKKTDYTKTPIEYGLTPYEILMDDIRSRRYKLNKVLVNGDLPPKVKKDAHDIILDFIRSRPPLKPASRRVLPPKKLNVTPQELLMKSICSPSAKASLKKTPGPPSPKKSFIEGYPKSIIPSIYTSDELDSSYPLKEKKPTSPKKLSNSSSLLSLTRKQRSSILCEKSRSSGNLKRLIRPDPHFLKFDPCGGDDDFFSSPLSPELKRSPSNSPTANKHNVFSSGMGRSHIQRRSEASLNKFVTNLSPILPEARRVSYTSPSDADSVKLRQLNLAMTSTPNILGSQGDSFISPQCSPKLNSKISRRDDWSIFNKCDLSLEEMIHIRSVHTKAELEDSVVEPRIKTDLESSKLCFLCMKNYFGFFSWSYKCKLCKKCVCSSCMTKIRIPSDDFSKISVKSIHDSLEREDSPNSNEQPRLKVRAFNSSVDLQDRLSSIPKNNKINSEPSSLPLTPTSTHDKKVKLRRSNTLKHERESFKKGDGTSMISVCLKCKEIIQHIPKSQRRQQVTRSLCLG